jgi:hypothetical protein
MYELCRHIKPSNQTCGSPAIKDTLFCYHHTGMRKLTRRRRRPNDFTYTLPFVFPEDRTAIQANQYLVMQALNEGRIDHRTANSYTSMLRACRINLGKTPLIEPDHHTAVQRVILTPEGDEIAPPRIMLEKGEAALTHGPDCPCRRCAEEFRDAPPEKHHTDCKCGLCEPATDAGTASIEPVSEATKTEEHELTIRNQPSTAEQSIPEHLGLENQPLRRSDLSAEGPSAVIDEASAMYDEQAINDQQQLHHNASQREAHPGRQPGNLNSPADRPHLSAEGPSAAVTGVPMGRSSSVGWSGEASAARTASPEASAPRLFSSTEKRYDCELIRPTADESDNDSTDDYKSILDHYWARQAAIEAGLEPPPWSSIGSHKPAAQPRPEGPKPMPGYLRHHHEMMKQVENNKQIAREIWHRRFPDQAASEGTANTTQEETMASNTATTL